MFIFSEPHDGIHGAMKALPKAVKNVIDGMNRERMSLAAALCRIREATPEGMKLSSHSNDDKTGGWIKLQEGDMDNMPIHVWMLIKYLEKKNGNETDS